MSMDGGEWPDDQAHDDQHQEYWSARQRRDKGLPSGITFLCGAVLFAGLGFSLFGTFGDVPVAAAEITAADDVASAEETETPVAVETAADALEAAADALEAEGEAAEAALSDDTATSYETSAPVAAPPAVATVSCRVQGMEIEAWRCIAPTGSVDNGGYLKLAGGGEVRRYGSTEVMRLLSGRAARVTLPGDYNLEIQSNGDSDYTLRVEIESAGSVVYQDEGSAYDTLRAVQAGV